MAPKLTESEQWERGQKFVRSLGAFSGLFTGCIRALLANHEANAARGGSGLNDQSSFALGRLLASPTVVSHLYHLTYNFHRERLEQKGSVTPREIVELYPPRDLASVLTVLYLYRLVRRRAPEEGWRNLGDSFRRYVDLGLHLGYAIPAIGPSRGLLVGALRHVAWGTFLGANADAMKKHRVALKMQKVPFSLELEAETWGTTHVVVASNIIQLFGYGVDFASAYMSGMLKPLEALSDDERAFRVTQLWLDALVQTGQPPEESLGDDYIVSDDRFEPFVQSIQAVLEDDMSDTWLARTRADIGSNVTPLLNFEPRAEEDAASENAEAAMGPEASESTS